jgi:hypothetical protein
MDLLVMMAIGDDTAHNDDRGGGERDEQPGVPGGEPRVR